MTYKAVCYIENSIEREKFEVVIVDNGSKDGSKEFFEDLQVKKNNLKYIYLNENYGFGKANNIGVKNACGDILVLINPDVEIHQKGFDTFIMENLKDDIGILAPKIVYSDGSVQPNCGSFATFLTYFCQEFRLGYLVRKYKITSKMSSVVSYLPLLRNTVVGKYLENFKQSSLNQRCCDWVSGACMILRKEIFELVGGFDENFFMYVEDEELCRRVKNLGYKIIVNYNFTIVHLEGVTQVKETSILSRARKERYKSSIYYFYKCKGISRALILKYFFILVQIMNSLCFLVKLDLSAFYDRLKFAKELFYYDLRREKQIK